MDCYPTFNPHQEDIKGNDDNEIEEKDEKRRKKERISYIYF
jgi:hypothetical protein